MRIVVAIATVILLLGQTSRPTSALQGSESVPPLKSIHMIDAQIGWATTYCGDCPIGGIWGLLHTTNGGGVWEDARPVDSAGRRIEVHFLYANSGVTWAQKGQLTEAQKGEPTETGGLLRSTDGGRTWKSIPIPAVDGVTPIGLTSITFINAREGWLLASMAVYSMNENVTVYRSTDGGKTWTKVGGPGLVGSKTSITFFNSTRGLITIGGLPYAAWKPYVYVTQDGGRTWREQNLPVPPPLYTQQLPPPLPDVSSDWQSSQGPPKAFTAKDGIMRVNYQNNYTGIAQFIKPMAVFYVTHDSGRTWKYGAPLPVKPGEYGAFQISSDFADINHGWLVDSNAHTLYATMDTGRQWTKLSSTDFPPTNQLNFISPQAGWAITSSFPFLLRTLDGGRTWIPITYTISRQ